VRVLLSVCPVCAFITWWSDSGTDFVVIIIIFFLETHRLKFLFIKNGILADEIVILNCSERNVNPLKTKRVCFI
jgi:hypothetical protein